MANNNNISQITDDQTMTSLQIAEITGKKHFNVLAAIRNMEPAWESQAGIKFNCSSYKDKSGKQCPMYILNQKECLFIATKFNDEARAKLVLRWEQLEKERQTMVNGQSSMVNDTTLPADPRNLTRRQLLLIALEAEEERERLKAEKEELAIDNQKLTSENQELEATNYGLMIESGQKDQQIQQLQERTSYLNVIMADTSTVTVTQIAQDYGMAAKAFNELMRGLHIQRKVGDQWILYGEHLNKGYVATRMIPIHHSCQPDTYKPMTAWTQKGRHFIYDSLKKHGILPLIERPPQASNQNL